MRTDNAGRVVLNTNDCIELLYNDKFKDNLLIDIDSDVDLYNKYTYIMNVGYPLLEQVGDIDNIDEFDKLNQKTWFMPEEYKKLDIAYVLIEKARKKPLTYHRLRTEAELTIYEKRGLLDLLRFLMYLVDVMRNSNIVWGVGRGSSVASYVLFLIGTHKVDSIKYKLNFNEFLTGE